MTYLEQRWSPSDPRSPVLILSEINNHLDELRKVERFVDGRIGFADDYVEVGGTGLSEVPFPPLDTLSQGTELTHRFIDRAEFEQAWNEALDRHCVNSSRCSLGPAYMPDAGLGRRFGEKLREDRFMVTLVLEPPHPPVVQTSWRTDLGVIIQYDSLQGHVGSVKHALEAMNAGHTAEAVEGLQALHKCLTELVDAIDTVRKAAP